MLARPTLAALGCNGCRTSLLRAVLGSAASAAAPRRSRAPPPRPAANWPRRLLSSQRLPAPEADADSAPPPPAAAQDGGVEEPWFLEEEPPRPPPSPHAPSLPEAPADAPALLDPMIKYIYEDMGLDDISLLDLRELDPPAALGPNLMMVFATTRSERHLHVASGRFVRWLKRHYRIDASADGLIGPGELKTKLRRLKKKAKLLGTNSMIVPGGDHGISTGWVCVNFTTARNDSGPDATPTFDDSGRFSGFGSASTGTTVVVQCMTEARRGELALEPLWHGILRRSLERAHKMRGESTEDKAALEEVVSSRIQQPSNRSASQLQWQALQQASQQQQQQQRRRRHFSTSARRRLPQADCRPPEAGQGPAPEPTAGGAGAHDLAKVQQQVSELQTSGIPVTQQVLENLIAAVLAAAPAGRESSAERLALVDQLLLTAQERGMTVWSRDMLVSLIEAVVKSPSYGPELQRSQRNLELLLAEMESPPDEAQTVRLMDAYARRRDWDGFWDAFRAPARFGAARSAALYELTYAAMAATGDGALCTDALRWLYPGMLQEEPPVLPRGTLYSALRACILVADPAAEELLHNPPAPETLDLLGRRRLRRREFVRVLREVEDLKRHLLGTQARREREHALSSFSTGGVKGAA